MLECEICGSKAVGEYEGIGPICFECFQDLSYEETEESGLSLQELVLTFVPPFALIVLSFLFLSLMLLVLSPLSFALTLLYFSVRNYYRKMKGEENEDSISSFNFDHHNFRRYPLGKDDSRRTTREYRVLYVVPCSKPYNSRLPVHT